jgi:hypothetical protein
MNASSDYAAGNGPSATHPAGQAGFLPLRRPSSGRMAAGVAAAVARSLGVDPVIVRVAFVFLALAGVLEDLPQPSSPAFAGPARRVPPVRPARHPRSGTAQLAVLALLAIVLVLVSHAVNWVLGPVPWVFVLCLLTVMAIRRRNRG